MKTKAILMSLFLLLAAGGGAGCVSAETSVKNTHVIYRAGSQATFEGPEKYFTGKVHVDMLFPVNATAHFSGASVTFEPKARSAWHTHPAGQHILVTSGVGLTQKWGGPVEVIRKGDVVWCPPGVKHWHGAAPNSPMTHLVITGDKDGKNVQWMEKVTDEQYFGGTAEHSRESTMTTNKALDKKQQSVISIAACTASGDMEKLKPALHAGLDAGLTVNETREIMVHLYAYTGFPRSLNGLFALMDVLEERKAKGVKDTVGKDASPLPADMDRDAYGAKVRAKLSGVDKIPPPAKWQIFAPVIDTFLKEHLFADLFARDVLSHQDRELTTIAALAAMTGTGGQLRFHLAAAMNTGLTEAQMKAFVDVLRTTVDAGQAESALTILTEVLDAGK